ncbi:MAG TPA: hypothetical protein VF943_07425 [Burkholderiales bacterium]
MQLLYVSAALALFMAVTHSYLGERRVFPKMQVGGGLWPIVRWAWHLTSITWVALAALLVLHGKAVGPITAGYFALCALLCFVTTRGRHIAWPFFTAAALAAWFGSAP